MTYADAIQFLYGLRLFGTKLGLDQTRQLARQAGDPQRHLRFIHVAGTNGKGSTCAMLESIYRAAGLRVGLFTSPHLVSFRERIQVNRQLIAEADVVRLVREMRELLADFAPGAHPTFFEVVTIMALRYFAEEACQLVVWETGLGGRLDATNIVTPLASVITNVQLDHEKWLGNTLAEIAREKAGIIKPGVPVLTAAQSPEVLEVIESTALRQQAPLTRVPLSALASPPLNELQLPLLGEHQRLNAALALATARVLAAQLPVPEPVVLAGLRQVQWPGRLQQHRTSEGATILLDGAHNPAGAEALRAALERSFPEQKPAFILGIFADKDWKGMCRILAPRAKRMLFAPVQSERTASPQQLEGVMRELDAQLPTAACASLADALARARGEPLLVITGSLHLVGEATELLGLLPPARDERPLNDWDAGALQRGGSAPLLR